MTTATRLAVALDLRQVGARDEIAALDVAAGGQVVEGHVDGIEVIDESLARMPVVDEQSVEPCLLEDDAVMDACRPHRPEPDRGSPGGWRWRSPRDRLRAGGRAWRAR